MDKRDKFENDCTSWKFLKEKFIMESIELVSTLVCFLVKFTKPVYTHLSKNKSFGCYSKLFANLAEDAGPEECFNNTIYEAH